MEIIHAQLLVIGMLVLLMIVAMITGWTWVVAFCAILIVFAGASAADNCGG